MIEDAERLEPEAARRTVLVVEDEVALRFIIATVLRDDAGLTVIEAKNADEALTLLRSNVPVDAVFTDIRMPGSLDGIQLVRNVAREFPAIRVATASGNLMHNEQLPGIRHFTKPYDLDEVRSHIVAMIEGTNPD